MERATIISLGNSTTPTATSFEQAFGEFSEFKGRGRARRQKRKMERIDNRKTRRKARQEGRMDKKRSRVEARAERRGVRSDAREQRRSQKNEGKRSRERADLEQEREFNPEESPEEAPQGGGSDSGYAPQGGGSDSGYAPQGGGSDSGYAPQGGGYDDGGYAEQGGSDSGDYAPQGGYDDSGSDDSGYGDDSGYDEQSDGFDGVIGSGNEMIDVPYSAQVNQDVMDAAKRIEWNLELASRLKEKPSSAKVNDAICKCDDRIAQLESSMDGYCNFEGDFTSDADGKMEYRTKRGGNMLPKQEQRRRRKEMMVAKMTARKQRNAVRRRNGLTPIQGQLNPQISPNRIEIPAKELGSNYTGIIGLDDANDYDANATEIKLGIEGEKTSKIPFKAIAIGLVVGGLGIFLLKKFKVI